MKASQYNVILPMGQLSLLDGGNALVRIRTSIRNSDKTQAAINSLSNLDSYRFWLCSSVERDTDDLILSYFKPTVEVVPLRYLISQWREEPALYLSQALDMARQIFRARGELENLHPFYFHISPAQVFSVRDVSRKDRWIILPLPIDAAIADFLRADEECWHWLSADELLGAVRDDRAYTVGAALYLSLIGDLFPNEIPRAECIRRVLSYRIGNPVFAHRVLRRALPKSLASTAKQLCDFIMCLLSPSFGRPLTMAQVSRQLDYFHEELSAYHLAQRWEDENDITRALMSLEYFVSTAPDREVPWDAVERLRRKSGDFTGAAEAAARCGDTLSLITRLRELAAAGEAARQELEKLVSTTRKKFLPKQKVASPPGVKSMLTVSTSKEKTAPAAAEQSLEEEDFLYLAYINGRQLGHTDETLLWLEHDFSVSWFKVVCCILKSRLFADKASWIKVIHNCRTGRNLVAKMPNAGGRLGHYADAYFDLLDGIANICEVYERNYSQEFLNDAFRYLNSAWLNQQMAETQDLDEAIISWLCWLDNLSSNNPKLKILHFGIEAFLQTLGAGSIRKNYIGLPEIPWFDESQVFIQYND